MPNQIAEWIRAYGPVLGTIVMVVQLFLTWFIWSLRSGFVTKEKCEKHRESLAEKCVSSRDKLTTELRAPTIKTSADLEDLKSRVEKLPDKSDIQEFSREIGEMNKTIGRLEGRLSGIGRAVDLMNQHLISKGNGE